MSDAVVFDTPGLIDIRAFTIFGMNAKPNTVSPIGYFGTGLKYAIAVLVRLKCEVSIWVGNTEYKFYLKDTDFRGSEFALIRMRKTRGLIKTYHELPFTTLLGKDWEMWMAFREIESNTRDEKGESYKVGGEVGWTVDPDRTKIVVTSQDFCDVYTARGEVFLNGGVQKDGDKRMQVFAAPSQSVYYRGLKVWSPDKPCLFTWNILEHQYLTEDRTLKHQILGAVLIAQHVVQSEDRDFIKAVLKANKEQFEGSLPFNAVSTKPSEAFMLEAPSLGHGHIAFGYYRGHVPAVVRSITPWQEKLAKAIRAEDDSATLRLIKSYREPILTMLDKVVDTLSQEDEIPFS